MNPNGKFKSDWVDRNTFYEEIPGKTAHYRQVDRPLICCLCGSTRFMEAFHKKNFQLTLNGAIVLSVGVNVSEVQVDAEDKKALDRLHLYKIDLADQVHILNVGGYVGETTREEILYARRQGKRIYWLEPDNVPPEFAHFGDAQCATTSPEIPDKK